MLDAESTQVNTQVKSRSPCITQATPAFRGLNDSFVYYSIRLFLEAAAAKNVAKAAVVAATAKAVEQRG